MLSCPLCPFEDEDENALMLHVDAVHFAQDSPSAARKNATEASSQPAGHDENNSPDELNNRRLRDDSLQQPAESSVEETSDEEYLPCPEDDCGEEVLWRDLQEHLDFHLAERLGLESLSPSPAIPVDPPAASSSKSLKRRHVASTASSGKASLSRRSAAPGAPPPNNHGMRLGKAELGPYAFEARMPSWLRHLLLDGAKRTRIQFITPTGQLDTITKVENEVRDIIPVLSRLIEDDETVSEAWLCHPAVQHVFKLPKEGGFCGYRNIQMMISFILNTQWFGWEALTNCLAGMRKNNKGDIKQIPNVLQLQDMIERAWDLGFNSISRSEIGALSGTRKFIGTPELQALLQSMNIPHGTFTCTDQIFPSDPPKRHHAHDQLLDKVHRYFSSFRDEEAPKSTSVGSDDSRVKVHCTSLPPLFLQQPGHSITIVGLEVRHDGSRNLLVFDPAFKPSAGIAKLVDKKQKGGTITSPRKLQKRTTIVSESVSSDSNTLKGSISSVGSATNGLIRAKNPRGSSESKLDSAVLLLEAYRRGSKRLGRHKEFEMLKLVAPVIDDDD